MPSDVISLATTGLGVSVLAGILSGICYVWVHKIGTRRRIRKNRTDWYCEICGIYVHPTASILNEKSIDLVKCFKCGAKVCSTKCAKFIQKARWICKDCLKPSQSWFQGILQAIQPSTSVFAGTMLNPDLQPGAEMDALRKLEKDQVRDFIEKLVNVMLGENVDNASISMLCNDNQYIKLFERYHGELSSTLTDLGSALHISMSNLPITGQSPCTAHAALKQLIEKLLKEAVNLPLLEKAHAHPAIQAEDTTNKTYEDLLATAIINKVITTCQNNLPSSTTNSVSSQLSSSSRNNNKEYFFGEETLDKKWKTTDLDTTSVSSLEEWLQNSDNSFGSKKYVDKVSLMIKQDIEVEHFDSENEEDDAEYFRSSSSLLNDSESNWFLQKRHFKGTASPVPVPMLVPNPSTEAKVLIGDKPLDDTSDLSDVGSDFEESAQPTTAQTLLIQSKHLIGGGGVKKNNYETVENADVQSESSTDSGVKEMNGQKSFDISKDLAIKTDLSIDDDNIEDSSFISVYSNTEKEAEYTERYASIPRQILKTSTPQKQEKLLNSPGNEEEVLEDTSDFEFIGGTYSKKEKEKWTHAIEMKNNPYSKENIEERIKRSNSSAGSIFGPDYYARLAGKPSGGGKASSEINGVSWPPPQQTDLTRSRTPSPPPELPKTAPPPKKLISESLVPELPKSPPPPKILPPKDFIFDIPPEPPKTIPPSREFIETDGIHQAVKALVSPEDTMPQKTLEKISTMHKVENYSVQLSTAEVTSESDTSFINFYDVEHAQVMKKTKNEDVHHIPIKPEAKPRKYEKASGITKQSNIPLIDRPILTRNLSESSLLDDSFDAHPKIIQPKKDNTLISKIYKDPKVRLFALNSREEIMLDNKSEYLTQKSLDSKVALAASASDDGLTSEYESGKTGKMSFFSSEEDLISLNSEQSFVATKNEAIQTPPPLITPKSLNARKYKFNSQEDLLSIDEVGSIPQRKDNTLISKIYQDHKVRHFALNTHRDFQPSLQQQTKLRKASSSDDEHNHNNYHHITIHKRNKYSSYDDLSSADISLDGSYQNGRNLSTVESINIKNNNSSTVSSVIDGYNSEDLDIDEIARRHVVRETLGKFSKSEMVINSKFNRGTSFDGDVRVSVRDLRKKFESTDVNNRPVVSSLTARSLSKKVKDSLKQ